MALNPACPPGPPRSSSPTGPRAFAAPRHALPPRPGAAQRSTRGGVHTHGPPRGTFSAARCARTLGLTDTLSHAQHSRSLHCLCIGRAGARRASVIGCRVVTSVQRPGGCGFHPGPVLSSRTSLSRRSPAQRTDRPHRGRLRGRGRWRDHGAHVAPVQWSHHARQRSACAHDRLHRPFSRFRATTAAGRDLRTAAALADRMRPDPPRAQRLRRPDTEGSKTCAR